VASLQDLEGEFGAGKEEEDMKTGAVGKEWEKGGRREGNQKALKKWTRY